MSAIDLRILLHAVRVGGDRDAPFALADWLEEHGDEAGRARAEYIRLDERARCDPAMAGQVWVEDRLAELRLEYGPAWLGPLGAMRGAGHWTLSRGLLWVWLRPAVLKRDRLAAVAEMAASGWMEGVRCEGWKRRHLVRLFGCAEIARLPALEVLNSRGPAPLEVLAANKHAADLAWLRIVHCGVQDEVLRELARSSRLASLRTLELPFNRLTSQGLTWLARSGLLSGLRTLNLEANRIGPRGARELINADGLPPLELKLAFNRLRCRGAVHLAGSRGLGRLRTLDLGWNGIGPEGRTALASSPYAGAGCVIRVEGNAT
jgi:uncharacterized protein (TIGR02996 family)